MNSYWNRVRVRRLSRRRVLAGTGGPAASAAFLAACRRDDSQSVTNNDQSGLIAPQKDLVVEAKPGGTLRTPPNTDIYGGLGEDMLHKRTFQNPRGEHPARLRQSRHRV